MKRSVFVRILMLVAVLFLSALKIPRSGVPTTPQIRNVGDERNPGDAKKWVDSVFNTLTTDEKIAQMIFVRAHSNLGPNHVRQIEAYIKNQKIGGLVFFQGTAEEQARLTNEYQKLSRVPLLVAIDAEWGLGMRLEGVVPLPHNMMLGAITDSNYIFEVGQKIGEQLKRVGAQIDFAPVVDINNNPRNPVINDRSFGEDKVRVADWGIQYMKGLQSAGIMAVAKHFPGHGDTDVDSHKALPVISKDLGELERVEMYPFIKMIQNGVKGVMIAHLEIPAIDNRPHRPMSVSKRAITDILRKKIGFQGLVVTDALEMKGVTDYYKNGQAELEAFKAGSDILELPLSVTHAIAAIKNALETGEVSTDQLNQSVKRILRAKYDAGLDHWKPVPIQNIRKDINESTLALNKILSDQAITLLNNDNRILPLPGSGKEKIAVVTVGGTLASFMEKARQFNQNLIQFHFSKNSTAAQAQSLVEKLDSGYDRIVIAVGPYNRYPAGRYGLSQPAINLINQLQSDTRTVTIAFGNPYALQYFPDGPATVAAYNATVPMQETAAELIFGVLKPKGELPVSIGREFPLHTGLKNFDVPEGKLTYTSPEKSDMDFQKLNRVDSLALEAVKAGATPGLEIMAMKDGKVFYQKAFGYLTYDKDHPVTDSTIYDMASVTKVMATTLACMHLYEAGKLNLDATLSSYLPWLKNSNKANIKVKDVLLHQARLIPDFEFKTFVTEKKDLEPTVFHHQYDENYRIRVARDLYMRADYLDTIKTLIRDSRLNPRPGYVYSDVSMQLMGYVVEQLTGEPLNRYVARHFYKPLGMTSTGFNPRTLFPLSRIAPTECEKTFREQCLEADVHDPRSALTGGVAGHAGLFSDSHDLGIALQMLLNGGSFDGKHYFNPKTVKLFTSYHNKDSRRGYGWDKTAKDQSKLSYPYPSEYASPEAFGHTGYTGTAVWADPKYHFVFIFLSNRVYPEGGSNTILYRLRTRGKIMDAFYEAMGVKG